MNTFDYTSFYEKLQNDEEYGRKVADSKTAEELIPLLAEANLVVTSDEANEILAQVDHRINAGELDDELLEMVNGGLGLAYLGKCALCGGVAGIGFGILAVGLYYAYRKKYGY